MDEYMQAFSKSALRLSRNPLGILALFLVLVYGFACIVVGFGVQSLDASERIPLIWFLVLFPVLGLWVFYLLVTGHHRKLYAPGDYKDEKLFITPLSEEVVGEKVEQEVEEVAASQHLSVTRTVGNSQPVPINAESIRNSFLEAEKLAFRALEEDLGFPIQQQVSAKGTHYDFAFDGLASVGKALHFFEVKYFQGPIFKADSIEAALHRVASITFSPSVWDSGKYDEVVFHFVGVVAFPREEIKEFAKTVRSRIRSELFAMQYHFYSLGDLRKRFENQG